MLLRLVRVDRAVGRVDGEQHGAGEAVALGENLPQLRQEFLGTVLLVAGDQHDLFALARPIAASVRTQGSAASASLPIEAASAIPPISLEIVSSLT